MQQQPKPERSRAATCHRGRQQDSPRQEPQAAGPGRHRVSGGERGGGRVQAGSAMRGLGRQEASSQEGTVARVWGKQEWRGVAREVR